MVRCPKFCVDPLKIHKRKIEKYLRKVPSDLLAKCGDTVIKLNKDFLLCVNCIKK